MTTPLLLLPNMMADARLFQPQIAALSAHRAVHVAPLLGDTIEDIAARIITHAPPQVALAGISMGGVVALEILRQAPDMVTRIALLDTTAAPEAPDVAAAREPHIARAKAGRLEDVMREEITSHHLAPGPARLEILNLLPDMAKGFGAETYEKQSRAMMRRPDASALLSEIDCPAMVLCGSHDTIFPVSIHKAMAEAIPGSTLEIIDDAGHLPSLEKPDETTAALERWLTGTLLLS